VNDCHRDAQVSISNKYTGAAKVSKPNKYTSAAKVSKPKKYTGADNNHVFAYVTVVLAQ
jgi:hypothetical protein